MQRPLLPAVESILPEAGDIRPWSRLRAELRRIDGWGSFAWKELLGAWRITPQAVLVITTPELDDLGGDADPDVRVAFLVVEHALGRPTSTADAVAIADWVLRGPTAALLSKPAVRAWTLDPGQVIRASNACWLEATQLVLRLHFELPYAGMGIDPRRVGRFLAQVAQLARALAAVGPRPGLRAHRRSVARQRALRAALPEHGLVAFIGEGSRLPRAADGGPAETAQPMRLPPDLRRTISLGRLGIVTGWGLAQGITVITGAPYHGKSTVLQALQAGIDDHPPGDGRETVVTVASALLVQAEDERAIASTDLSRFFTTLPGARPTCFSTAKASGATSMAASVEQGIAAGCRLLLIDEDTAASNFLVIDPLMRRLLGPTLDGTTTLLETLPALAAAGVATVLVAGSSSQSLAVAERVVQMDHWQPHEVTTRARRLIKRAPPSASAVLPRRWLCATPDALFGPRHFAPLDLREPQRPRLKIPMAAGPDLWLRLDLRRSGWVVDEALVAGAVLAAGWVCRLAAHTGDREMASLEAAYDQLVASGATALDPFHGRLLTVPPWQLVVSVLERLPLAFSGSLLAHL